MGFLVQEREKDLKKTKKISFMCLGKIYIYYTDVDLSSWVIFMVCIISHGYKGTIFNIKGSLWTQMCL